jgi:hypothetical protein
MEIEEIPVTFVSGAFRLDGRLARRPGSAWGMVVCHPHPAYGGDMENSVVRAAVRGAWSAGASTLRFDFRGVGRSEGQSRGGSDETDDARAAVAFLAESAPGLRVALVGYSFGAMIAARVGPEDPRVERVGLIALPIGMFDPGPVLQTPKPVLFLQGDRDSFCPVERLEELVTSRPFPTEVRYVPGADHFLLGFEEEIAAAVGEFLRRTEALPPSRIWRG